MNHQNQKINTFSNFENLSFHEESQAIEITETSKSVSDNIKRSLVITPNTFSPSRDENIQRQKLEKKYIFC